MASTVWKARGDMCSYLWLEDPSDEKDIEKTSISGSTCAATTGMNKGSVVPVKAMPLPFASMVRWTLLMVGSADKAGWLEEETGDKVAEVDISAGCLSGAETSRSEGSLDSKSNIESSLSMSCAWLMVRACSLRSRKSCRAIRW